LPESLLTNLRILEFSFVVYFFGSRRTILVTIGAFAGGVN
jgi:hypothetical protein